MLPEILRYNINEFGRWTLIRASEMREEGISLNVISADLGLPEEAVENCILAGDCLRRMAAEQLRRMAAEQRRYEAAIVEPY